MTSTEIRQSFLDFFRDRKHTVVASSSLLPDSPNLLFTNAGMNQFVPIFLGQQKCPYVPGRAADTQKCIRAGGKHNDLEDVGLDTYHHTFFEMLGNWSFGDYFKQEAIEWAWELITGVWKFPKERIYATVYSPAEGDPSEFDREAYGYWEKLFTAAGLDPKIHIVHGNKKDNFWMMGETGPCGPCSELHVDLTPAGDTKGSLVNKGDGRCIEIWNLVFIQFNANPDGSFSPLPAQHVDTGMGFERVASIIQGTKGFSDFSRIISNYDTDIFRLIFDKIEQLSGKKYTATLPKAGSSGDNEQEKEDVAFRVIADHIRTLSFAIADGIQPGNTDRNYVLRRILRRAVRYGRTLGFHRPFFFELVDVLADKMGDTFPEIRQKREHVRSVIRGEEEAFNKTLDRGIELFTTEAQKAAEKNLSGDFAFRLYDTYGFPRDLTELMAREQGLTVDVEEFDRLMEEQRTRARAAQKKEVIELSKIETTESTHFVGYDNLETSAKVLETVRIKDRTGVILNTTACYAEMGGQVGDTGGLSHGAQLWKITDTRKSGQAWLHFLADTDDMPLAGMEVNLLVDSERRSAIERHHTVTHLLHWALHEVVSKEASQKGSYVGADKLTFDFNHTALTPQQIADIENLVNARILENAQVYWTEMPYADVRANSGIMQVFGDKYGDTVRVVQIGGGREALNGYSMELCGGTHTRATGEIGLFRIVSEAAIAAGIRRIEAVAGFEARTKGIEETELLKRIASKFNAPLSEIEKRIESLLSHQKELEKQLKTFAQKQAVETSKDLLAKAHDLKGIPSIIANIGNADGDTLQAVADALKSSFKGLVVLGGVSDGTVSLVAAVTSDYTDKVKAGQIIQQIAPMVGGKGGGRPDNARGGGKDPTKLDEALASVSTLL
ncbi:MAG: alanine--tRNA ligase [Chthoniobacterales bacterium]